VILENMVNMINTATISDSMRIARADCKIVNHDPQFRVNPENGADADLFGSTENRHHLGLTMSAPDCHLVRKAFLTKYGYPADLSYAEILREFHRRYDHAQAVRHQNAGLHKIMLIIEGIAESAAKEEASLEREARKRKIERLTENSDYGFAELDQLVEGFVERLEAEWIQKL
jgi:hypothetical protein